MELLGHGMADILDEQARKLGYASAADLRAKHPRPTPEEQAARDREYWQQKRIEQSRKIVPAAFSNATLTDLTPEARAAVTINPGEHLYLWGQAGVGKSHAMAALMRHLFVRYMQCTARRIAWYELLQKLYQSESEMEVLSSYLSCDFLFIEDIGVTTNKVESDHSRRTFWLVMDKRIETQKTLCLTSNKSPEELGESFDDRIASRLKVFRTYHCNGKDRRSK
jgi:DNA replication protein DnaC